jgi:hypothetical protein
VAASSWPCSGASDRLLPAHDQAITGFDRSSASKASAGRLDEVQHTQFSPKPKPLQRSDLVLIAADIIEVVQTALGQMSLIYAELAAKA